METFTADVEEQIRALTGRVFVGMDIGATNSRVVIGDVRWKLQIAKFENKASTRTIIRHLQELEALVKPLLTAHVYAACVAAAGPIDEKRLGVRVTNFTATDEDQLLKSTDLPEFLFPKGVTRFLNDLEAACYGVLALDDESLNEIFEPLWPSLGDHVNLSQDRQLVQAMGTGLGVALLLPTRSLSPFGGPSGGNLAVVPTEGGHLLVSPPGPSHPSQAQEFSLYEYISKQCGYDGTHSIEVEDICSGRGLQWVYEFLALNDSSVKEKKLNAGQISEKALGGCAVSKKAMEIHYTHLARAAQTMCIGTLTKSVFWAGDNQVYNYQIVKSLAENLRAEFLRHPKKKWVENVPIFIQKKQMNLNLLGTLHVSETACHFQ